MFYILVSSFPVILVENATLFTICAFGIIVVYALTRILYYILLISISEVLLLLLFAITMLLLLRWLFSITRNQLWLYLKQCYFSQDCFDQVESVLSCGVLCKQHSVKKKGSPVQHISVASVVLNLEKLTLGSLFQAYLIKHITVWGKVSLYSGLAVVFQNLKDTITSLLALKIQLPLCSPDKLP